MSGFSIQSHISCRHMRITSPAYAWSSVSAASSTCETRGRVASWGKRGFGIGLLFSKSLAIAAFGYDPETFLCTSRATCLSRIDCAVFQPGVSVSRYADAIHIVGGCVDQKRLCVCILVIRAADSLLATVRSFCCLGLVASTLRVLCMPVLY